MTPVKTEPLIRLHLFFATENNSALILRQGPSRHFSMISWRRDSDTLEDGQWIKSKVYVERCALSPDERQFLYFLLDGRWNNEACGSYTALLRPPYWPALSLFPQGDTWAGGGVFVDNTHYYAFGDSDIIWRDEGLSRVTVGNPAKGCSTGVRLMSGGRAPLDRATSRRLLARHRPADSGTFMDWLGAPKSDAMDRYDTLGGRLYRRRGQELELIRDFTDMDFEPIRALYDWHDEREPGDPATWHPLNRDYR